MARAMTSDLPMRQPSGAAVARPARISELAAGFRADKRRQTVISIALIGPLVAFIVFAFVLPLATMLFTRSTIRKCATRFRRRWSRWKHGMAIQLSRLPPMTRWWQT